MLKSLISIIIPMYNEEENIIAIIQTITNLMQTIDVNFEIICIDDGSSDNTWQALTQLTIQYATLRLIKLSRNFGKEAALTAGLLHAQGDAVIPIDADFQDPPELIVKLINKWQEGYDIVYVIRNVRDQDTFIKRKTSNWFYLLFNRLSNIQIPNNAGDFRIIDRRVVDTLNRLPEHSRFMKGLYSWVGFKQTAIECSRAPRLQGDSKWGYWKLWNYALDGITSFSTTPLRVSLYLGLGVAVLAFFYAFFLFISTLIFGISVPGYASIMVSVLFFGGVQLITLGFLGEYIGRIHEAVKNRPLYIIDKLDNFGTK